MSHLDRRSLHHLFDCVRIEIHCDRRAIEIVNSLADQSRQGLFLNLWRQLLPNSDEIPYQISRLTVCPLPGLMKLRVAHGPHDEYLDFVRRQRDPFARRFAAGIGAAALVAVTEVPVTGDAGDQWTAAMSTAQDAAQRPRDGRTLSITGARAA